MVRTQIQLTEEQARKLKILAAREGVSIAALIRRSVDKTVTESQLVTDTEIRQRAKAAAGCLHSGTGDLSEKHDNYLMEAFSD